MPINKFTTLQDLARQAKIITGETATFDGKIQVGIPFSGYPSGVDTATTVSLGIISSEDAVFSGNTGTTIFDVSNTGSTNYSPIFSGYSGSVWTNLLFSGNTSGLTLPITPLSADTQIVGPFWSLTQTGMTGDYIIGIQYTGYSITYSFFNVSEIGTGFTYSGFTTASQENFSAGTLDYKGPLDYISTKEDASVEGRLITNKITITNGASATTIGYVLTQTGENGEGEWVINASADTNTFTTGATLSGNVIEFDRNDLSNAYSVDLNPILSGFTGGNIYNTDGVITNSRTVSMEDTLLTFDGGLTGNSFFNITAPLLNTRFTNGNVIFKVESGLLVNYFNLDDTESNLGFLNESNNQFIGIVTTSTQMFVGTDLSGLTGFTGVEYVGDYSANFVNRSLVDKEYVDNSIPPVIGVYLPLNVTTNTQVNLTAENLRFIATGASEIESFVLTGGQKKSVLVDNTTASISNRASDLSQITYFVANNTQAEISYSGSSGATTIGIEEGMVVIGSTVAGFEGVIYNADYSANFVDRSLVDKGYVNSQINNFYDLIFVVGSEDTQITTGTSLTTIYAPRNFVINKVKLSLSNSGVTTTTVDVKINGSSIFMSPVDITSGNTIVNTVVTQSVTEDDKITVDVDAAGGGATGLKTYLIGNT